MDDDFEIEVTNLNTGATTRHALSHITPDQPEPDDDEPDNEPTSRPSTRRRWRGRSLRAAVVSAVVVLAAVLVIITNPTAQSSLYSMLRFPTPVPSPTPLPGGNLVYLVRGAPWGKVALDGKATDFANLGMQVPWIRLSRGHHFLTVTQTPFPTLRCTLSVPAAANDSCPLLSSLNDQYEYGNGLDIPLGSRFVDLGARFDQLPRDAQDALVAAVNAQINLTSRPLILQPGDHYLRDDGSLAVVRTPLQATFIPTLLTPANPVASDGESCVSFCDMSGIGYSTGGAWDIMVSVLGSWRIATLSGQVVADHAPVFSNDPIYNNLSPSIHMLMSVLWTGNWQMSMQNQFGFGGSPVCDLAQQASGAAFNAGLLNNLGIDMRAGKTAEQGCALEVTLNDPSNSTPIFVYYRLGVLLAVNDVAHRALQMLPVASANERAQFQQIFASSHNP